MTTDPTQLRRDSDDRLANELVACGALFGIVSGTEQVEVERIIENEETAAFVIRLGFLRSPYRVTVTMEPEPDYLAGEPRLPEDRGAGEPPPGA
jgi:hypothetical protein